MKLSSIINKDCSKAAVLFNSKKRALEYISELASQHLPEHNAHEILDAFLTREKLGSTGIGKGRSIGSGIRMNELLAHAQAKARKWAKAKATALALASAYAQL